MTTLPPGLHRAPKSGVFYLRRRIPTALLSCYPGKREVVLSLRTKELSAALIAFRVSDGKLAEQWQRDRDRLYKRSVRMERSPLVSIKSLTAASIEGICQHVEAASLSGDDQRRLRAGYADEELDEYIRGYKGANDILRAALAKGDKNILIPLLEQFLDLYRYQVDVPKDEMERLSIAYGHAAARTNELLLKRCQGEYVPSPNFVIQRDTPLLSEVVKKYIERYEKSGKRQMLRKVKGVLPLLVEVVGDKPIGMLQQPDLLEFFELVEKLPPRWTDVCRQRKINARAVAELGLDGISKGTFDGTYLAVMGPFLKYCYGHWTGRGWSKEWTIEGITYTGRRVDPEGAQRPITIHELNRLFSNVQMKEFASDPTQVHKFWLPTLALFTGARVNELCQLNPQVDIQEDSDSKIWFLDITESSVADERIDKSVKTTSSKRKVPIHPTLIELGFLKYVAHVKKRGDKLLFAAFPPSLGRASPLAAKWFREFLRDSGLRDETSGERFVGMHAFRSTFLHYAMVLGVANAERITGHTSETAVLEMKAGAIHGKASTVVRKYRGNLPIKQLMDILSQVNYEGLVLPKPIFSE